ncbi:hypothetical protein [Methanospirillum lacunae]|nr:hypothetical protein [Methanospirillum lacunae]
MPEGEGGEDMQPHIPETADLCRDSHSVRSACNLLFSPGQTVEVRFIGKRGAASGFFDNYDRLESAVTLLENRGEYAGAYVTLNPVNPDLLARRANRIETRLGRDEKSAGDSDIISRRWLPIDIDPVRPSGVSSSREEHEAAEAMAFRIRDHLTGMGWPDPVIADSGNGAHLLYRIDLPNDEESRDLIRTVLETLHILFSDEKASVDTTVFNAARIWKLYGTTSRKGDNIAARPHRRASILSVPPVLEIVSGEMLSNLADLFPKEPSEKTEVKTVRSIDLGAWLNRNSISFNQKPYAGGSIFVLSECPFSSEHKDGAYAIQFANGAIFAGCHHASCGGGTQRWPELREQYEGKRQATKCSHSDKGQKKPVTQSAEPISLPQDNQTTQVQEEIKNHAETILHDGNPFGYLLETFALEHEGDQTVAESLIMSLASRLVLNSKGLHVSITGESGKGKSHAIKTMLRQVPSVSRLDGRLSEKALFYINGLKPGTVIALDDQALSDQMQEILKGVTSSFDSQFVYRTVSKDRTAQECIIPERCVWWIAKVDGTGDDQVYNRMLTCWIDDSEDQDIRVLKRSLSHASCGPASSERERDENLVCQEIWSTLSPAFVIVPFADRIRFVSAANRRNPDMLLDLIRASAVLMQHQRSEVEMNNVRCVYATEEDFAIATRLYTSLNGESGSQVSKLTRREAELVVIMHESGRPELTVSDLQILTGWNNSSIHKLLNGYLSKGQSYSGLLAKCPAVSFYDRTVTSGSDGKHTQRRQRVYTWDPSLYLPWSEGGVVWLVREEKGADHIDGDDPGGSAAEDGTKRNDAGGCRSKNESDSSLESHKIIDYKDSDQRAAEGEGVKQVTGPDGEVCTQTSDPGICRIAALGDQINPPDGRLPESGKNIRVADQDTLTHDAAYAALTSEPGICSSDFSRIDGWPEKRPCAVCGSLYSRYRERGHGKSERMLCDVCYEAAQVREALSVRTIPGVIRTDMMEHRTSPTGKCSVCRTGAAVWVDPVQQVALCETCYHREQKGKPERGEHWNAGY